MIKKLKFNWNIKLTTKQESTKENYKYIIKDSIILNKWLWKNNKFKTNREENIFSDLLLCVINDYEDLKGKNGKYIVPTINNYNNLSKMFWKYYKKHCIEFNTKISN